MESKNTAKIKCIHWFAGPVVFPDPPTDGPMETSGVIVGASGFGFVPPGAQRAQSKI